MKKKTFYSGLGIGIVFLMIITTILLFSIDAEPNDDAVYVDDEMVVKEDKAENVDVSSNLTTDSAEDIMIAFGNFMPMLVFIIIGLTLMPIIIRMIRNDGIGY